VAAVGVKGPGGLEVVIDEEGPAVPAGRLLFVGDHTANASVGSLETERAVFSALCFVKVKPATAPSPTR
jgi:hypothetical protein